MGFFDRLRKMLAGPPHVQGGDAEGTTALQEEFGAHEEGAADLRRPVPGGATTYGYATQEAAEAAEEDLASEEAPPVPDP